MMTVPELISMALASCERFDCYQGDAGKLRFFRERNSLVKAIARFGYVCHERGWDFTTEEIVKPILDVILSVRGREEEIKMWLPRYLECAIDKHVRMKADDYAAKAKAKKEVPNLVKKVVSGTQVAVIREPTHMEILAAAYGDKKSTVKKHVADARKKGLAVKKQDQFELL